LAAGDDGAAQRHDEKMFPNLGIFFIYGRKKGYASKRATLFCTAMGLERWL